jgi:hypothetical protein
METEETKNLIKIIRQIEIQYPTIEKFINPYLQGLSSNNWVVGATKSKSGSSIHACDPHCYKKKKIFFFIFNFFEKSEIKSITRILA